MCEPEVKSTNYCGLAHLFFSSLLAPWNERRGEREEKRRGEREDSRRLKI